MGNALALAERSIVPDTAHCLDWRVLLNALPSASVDLLLTDMPYNTTACEWEHEVDLSHFWQLVKRIMKPHGAVVLTGSQPFTSRLVISNLAWFRYEWIWEKSLATGYLNANRVPMKAHENVLVFYSVAGIYRPQFEVGMPYRATSGAVGGHVRDKTVGGYVTESDGHRYPRSVQRFNSELDTFHPTQKPVALFEYLIRTYTHEGDLVVDPFCGSGTTAVAARNTKRRYIVGDTSRHYVNVTLDRLRMPFEPRRTQQETRLDDLPLFAGEATIAPTASATEAQSTTLRSKSAL